MMKVKKQEMRTFRWESGENEFQLNVVDGNPTMLSMQLEKTGSLIVHEPDSILMIKQFFTELEMEYKV